MQKRKNVSYWDFVCGGVKVKREARKSKKEKMPSMLVEANDYKCRLLRRLKSNASDMLASGNSNSD